jgi:DNA-binding Xre family transcriptional regulator
MSLAYRLARPQAGWRQLHLQTLETVCDVFRCEPGRLIERVPDEGARRKRRW